MSVFINYKICDNADECSGIDVCPANALFWDSVEKTVATDNDKCLSCDACVEACPAGAILVAHNEEEAVQIQNDIDNDPRTIQDLMVERYGASPVGDTLISIYEAEEKIDKKTSLVVVEIIDKNDAPCLINSVPISEAFGSINFDYNKVDINDNGYELFAKKYAINDCPTLLIFENGLLLSRINGAVDNTNYNQKSNFLSNVKNTLSKIKK